MTKIRTTYTKACEHCGVTYVTIKKHGKYCCHSCSAAAAGVVRDRGEPGHPWRTPRALPAEGEIQQS